MGQEGRLLGLSQQDFVFDQRTTLHYSYRLGCHVSLLIRGLTRSTHRRRWAALAGISIFGDVVIGRALAKRRPNHYLIRLLVDTCDVAAWVPVGKKDASTTRAALLVPVPHAIEAGYTIGAADEWSIRSVLRALMIPIVTTGVAVLVRRRRQLGTGGTQVFWGVMAVALGSLLGRHELLERRRLEAAGEEIVAGRARAARLQGEAEIAVGGAGGPPHDLKKELLVLANSGSSIAEGAAQELMGRKQHLAERTAAFGAYIGELLTGISFIPEDTWSVRLSSEQAAHLHAEIDEHGRPNVVTLINEAEARRPGGRVVLEMDGRQIELAGQAPPRHWLADPAPLAFLLSAFWRLSATIPTMGSVPWPVTVPGAAAEIVAMLAYRSAPVPADPIAPVKAAFVSAVAYGCAATRTARRVENAEGEQIFPAAGALHGYCLVAARYWDDLNSTRRRWAIVGGVGLGSIVLFASPRRLDWAALAGELAYALVPCFAPLGFDRRKQATVEFLLEDLQATIDWEVDEARRQGRIAEIDLTKAYVDRAEAALAEVGGRIASADAVDIRARCQDARTWLDAARG